jgi:hypothetical protein
MAVEMTISTPILLSEYAQTLPQTSRERVFVENMVGESDVMRAIPFVGVTGGRKEFLDISSTPVVTFRQINAPGGQAVGTFNLREEDTFFVDEYIFADRAIVDRLGKEHIYKQERLKSIALAQMFSTKVLKGDNTNNPQEPNGLQIRCNVVNTNQLHNSASSGGAALSLTNMDKLYWLTNKPTHWVAPRTLMPYFDAAARNNSLVNQLMSASVDDYGRSILKYRGLPILFGYEPDDTPDMLPMTEVASGGGSAVTGSVYCVSFREGGIYAIQQTPLTVVEQGEIPGTPQFSTHIKWDWGTAREHPRACSRLDSISQAALVA